MATGAITPFTVIDYLMTNDGKYETLGNGDKKKNFFVVNRRLSINYPMHADILQHIRINPVAVLDFWHSYLPSKHKTKPGWLFIAGEKKAKETEAKKQKISKDAIVNFAKFFNYDIKSVNDALEFFGDDMVAEIKEYERYAV